MEKQPSTNMVRLHNTADWIATSDNFVVKVTKDGYHIMLRPSWNIYIYKTMEKDINITKMKPFRHLYRANIHIDNIFQRYMIR